MLQSVEVPNRTAVMRFSVSGDVGQISVFVGPSDEEMLSVA